MRNRNTVDPRLNLETPDIIALRGAVAAAPDAERPAAEAALARAIKAREDEILDQIRDEIVENSEKIDAAIFDPAVEAANERLRYLIDFLIVHFSITRHPTSKSDIPHGMAYEQLEGDGWLSWLKRMDIPKRSAQVYRRMSTNWSQIEGRAALLHLLSLSAMRWPRSHHSR